MYMKTTQRIISFLLVLIMVIGMVLMLALGLRAMLQYSMSLFLLADEPERGL